MSKNVTTIPCKLVTKVYTHDSQRYPPGTEYYNFLVTDHNESVTNKYIPIPWAAADSLDNAWIETMPPCIEVYAKEDELEERLKYFEQFEGVSISKPTKYTQESPIYHVSYNIPNDFLSNIFNPFSTENADTVSVPCEIESKALRDPTRPDSLVGVDKIPITRSGDACYGFENVKSISECYNKTSCDNPRIFTHKDPLNICSCQHDKLFLHIDDKDKPIKFNIMFYDSQHRHKLSQNAYTTESGIKYEKGVICF
jgi:hypothetical protein